MTADDFLENSEEAVIKRIEEMVDIVFIIISQNTESGPIFYLQYLGIINKLIKDRFPVVPLIENGIKPPQTIESIIGIPFESSNINGILNTINTSIIRAERTKDLKNKTKNAAIEKIENNLWSYIDEVTNKLGRREKRNLYSGNAWNITGFSLLLIGAIIIYLSASSLLERPHLPIGSQLLISLKLLAMVSFLGASSRYAFLLGKAYTHESLRAADRIHAIEFGKFYLKAYGDRITDPAEIQNIFQTWNIDSGSQFSKISPDGVDPKILEKIVDAFSKVAGKDK